MEAYQQRVVDEKAELSDRLDRLQAFVDGPYLATVPSSEKTRLIRQIFIMRLYEQVLCERITAF